MVHGRAAEARVMAATVREAFMVVVGCFERRVVVVEKEDLSSASASWKGREEGKREAANSGRVLRVQKGGPGLLLLLESTSLTLKVIFSIDFLKDRTEIQIASHQRRPI